MPNVILSNLQQKIAKRGRKLVDYDHARHTLATLESAKKRDEGKIVRVSKTFILNSLLKMMHQCSITGLHVQKTYLGLGTSSNQILLLSAQACMRFV